ncbi:carboxypeptidase regulatory-like domain-containing protein [bacterium]|nr:carboxypeptidase regulatory-like domain-containing protein [bacterium]
MRLIPVLLFLDTVGFHVIRVMVSLLWQSSILIMGVLVLTYFLRQRRASILHVIMVSMMIIVPLIPLFAWIVSSTGTPRAPIRVIPGYTVPEMKTVLTESSTALTETESMRLGKTPVMSEPAAADERTAVKEALPQFPVTQDGQARRFLPASFPWAMGLIVYCAGAAMFLFMTIMGRLRIRRWLLYSSVVTDGEMLGIFRRARNRLGLTRDFVIVETPEIEAPMTIGTIHPVVMLPEGFSEDLDESELEAVALHELAHIRRFDSLTLGIVSYLRAALFFHPLLWASARRIETLAEHACDDAVLDALGEPLSYAKMLARIAENLPVRAIQTELATGIIFSRSAFFRRVEAILSDRRDHIRKLSRLALAGTVAAAALTFVIALALPLDETGKKSGNVDVSGIVVFEDKTIPDAEIYLNDLNHRTLVKVSKTDSKGAFSFEMNSSLLEAEKDYRPSVLAYSPDYAVGLVQLGRYTDPGNLIVRLDNRIAVSGTVRDEAGKPLAGADINVVSLGYSNAGNFNYTLFDVASLSALRVKSDGNGSFRLLNIPGGRMLMFSVAKGGYATAVKIVTLAADQSVDISLAPAVSLSGTVQYGDSGKPAANVRISTRYPPATPLLTAEVKTDQNGRYTIPNLPSGPYTLHVYAEGKWTAQPRQNIEVKPGENLDNVDFKLIGGAVVKGKVVDGVTNEPIAGHWIGYKDLTVTDWMPSLYTVLTDENGEFFFTVPPGKARFQTASPDRYQLIELAARDTTVAEGKVYSLDTFVFEPGITVRGTTRTYDGAPVSGVVITGEVGINLVSDSKGRFELAGQSPDGKLTLYASHPEKSLSGKVDIVIKPRIEVELLLDEFGKTSVEGRVVDNENKPIPNAAVQLVSWNDQNRGTVEKTAITDKQGKYRFDGLTVGKTYLVAANADGYIMPSILKDDQFIADKDMQPLKDFVMTKGDRWIEGTITDESGKPVSGVRVSVQQGSGPSISAETDSHGHYRLDNLSGSTIRQMQVSYTPYQGSYTYEYISTNMPYDFVLKKGKYSLLGTVVDTDGKPVEGVSLYTRDQYHEAGTFWVSTRTAGDGSFRFDSLMNDTVKLYLSAQQGDKRGELKSKQYGPYKADGTAVTVVAEWEQPDAAPGGLVEAASPSARPYEAKLLRVKPPIRLDGELGDWKGIGATPMTITESNPESMGNVGARQQQSKEDISADLQCIADGDFIYIGIDVTDDNIVFRQPNFEYPFSQDCIELFFDGKNTHAHPAQIFLTAFDDGRILLSGRNPVTDEKYMYFWEAVGVQAALKKSRKGYVAELAVPWSALKWAGCERGKPLGMNMRVYDSDMDGDAYSPLNLIEWVSVPGMKYQDVTFAGRLSDDVPEWYSPNWQKLNLVFSFIGQKNYNDAVTTLKEAGNDFWVNPILADVLQKMGRPDESAVAIGKIIEQAGDGWQADACIRSLCNNANQLFHQRDYKSAISLLQAAQTVKPSTVMSYQAHLLLGKCYFMNGEYEKAETELKELLKNNSVKDKNIETEVAETQRVINALDRIIAQKR